MLADAVMLVRNDTTTERARRDLTYSYDLNGNLKTVDNTKAGASDYTVGYDELNRPTQVTQTTGANTATTAYSYDPVGRPDTVTIAQVAPLKDQFFDYTWDVRGLLSSVVTGASASDPAKKTTSYSYDNRGLRRTQTKGNGNKVAFTWFDNGSMASTREVKPDGRSLVTEHLLAYDPDGNRVRDAARVLNSDTKALDSSAAVYSYEPRGRVTSVDRTGAGASDESYAYSGSSNITSQTVAGVTTNYVYDRDRLQKSTVVNGPSAFHNHDPFGRLDTITSGGAVIGRYVYDGFDRIVEQRTGTGTSTKTTRSTFDAWDRPATKTDAGGKTTAMSYLGLSSQLLAELDTGTGKQKTAYTFDAYGQRLTQTSEKSDGTAEDAWYGYSPHSDVETLTTAAGETKSTYGYTAYGKDRTSAMTGADKPGVNPEPYNLYRFNAKRWDSASGDYDMGFRTYNPGLNRFVSRDMYNGALADLSLGTDPWNSNRYAFAGGNPISRVELDGHVNECLSCDGAIVDIAVNPSGAQDSEDSGGRLGAVASAVKKASSAAVNTVAGYQRGTFEQGLDTVKSTANMVGNVAKCNLAWQCDDYFQSQQDSMMALAHPIDTFTAITEPVRNDWNNGRRPQAVGRVGVMLGEAAVGSKGLSAISKASRLGTGMCSFTGATLVMMADGTTKPISKVKVGDEVLATDPKTGKKGPRKVTRLWVHKDTVLKLETADGAITTTEDHPYWNTTGGQWQRADQLDTGDGLLTPNGRIITVTGIHTASQHAAQAYNLTVNDLHTYYVLAGQTPVLVHNCGPGNVADVAARHGGELVEQGYRFPSRRAARQGASELVGDMGSQTRAIRANEFRGGPFWMKNSNKVIGRMSLDGTRGYRDDFLGHDFGDGDSIGPHVNVWGLGIEDGIHFFY